MFCNIINVRMLGGGGVTFHKNIKQEKPFNTDNNIKNYY